jgi:hypothetical protein
MPRYISGRTKRKSQSALTDERYKYLDVSEAEPNLGDPVLPGDSPPFGQQYQIVSVEGYPGERYWIPVGGGIIPGSISIFDENNLVGGLSSTTQLNFVGTAISAIGVGGPNPGIAVTVSFIPPGNDTEILFKNSGDFSSSPKLTFDVSTGLVKVGDQIQVGNGGTVITATSGGLIGIGTTNPTQELHVKGDIRLTGTIYDYLNDPGIEGDILVKNSLNGLIWVGQDSLRTGAGGTYTNVQYHNSAGLVDGAPNFVYNDITGRVGIGSTQPQYLLDVLGNTRIVGHTTVTGNFFVSGISTFTSFVDVNGGAFIDNIRIGITNDNEIDTASGDLTIDSASGSTIIDDNLRVSGILTAQNNVDLGSSSSNTVTFIADVDSDILPSVNLTQNLGASDARWNLYVNNIFGNENSSFTLGNLNVLGISTLGSDSTDTVDINARIRTDLIPSQNYTYDLGSPTLAWDSIYADELYANLFVGIANTALTIRTASNNSSTINYLTFVDSNNGSLAYENVYTSANIKYVPSTGSLEFNNLSLLGNSNVAGIATFSGNVILGNNVNADEVTFNSKIASAILPTLNDTFDLGSLSLKWNEVYATTFNGQFIGNADTASRLENSRNIAITGDLSWNVNFDGSTNVTSTGTLANTGVVAGTYGDVSNYPIITVDSKGRITSASEQLIDFANATVLNSDNLKTVSSSSNLSYYLPFVLYNVGAAGTYQSFYTDTDIRYNPSSNLLTIPNVSIGNSLTVNNDSYFGSDTSDNIVFNGLIDSNIIPDDNLTWNLGSASLKWNQLYVNTINVDATINGTIQQADKIKISAGTLNQPYYLTFTVDANDITGAYEDLHTDSDVSYNPSTNTLSATNTSLSGNLIVNGNTDLGSDSSDTLTINALVDSNVIPSGSRDLGSSVSRWNNVYANTFNGSFVGNADTATRLATSRNIAITGDLSWNVNFDGSANVTSTGTLANTGVVANTYGSNVNIPVLSIDSKGRVTSASVVAVNFSAATVLNSDRVSTGTTTGITDYFLTFADSNNLSRDNEFLYTDSGITYNPNTDLLSVGQIKPTKIIDNNNSDGDTNYVLTSLDANGTLGWRPAGTPSGSAAIGGITVQDDGVQVGDTLGITTVNFVNSTVTQNPNGTVSVTPSLSAIGGIGGITIQDDGTQVGNTLGITTVNFVNSTVTQNPNGTVSVSINETQFDSRYLRKDTSDTSFGMKVFYTNMTSNDDLLNSPISIRERGLSGAGDGEGRDAPNLNFHWSGRVSNSLWMDSSGNLNWGSYNTSGVPTPDGSLYLAGITLTGVSNTFIDTNNIESIRISCNGKEVFRINENSPNVSGGRRIIGQGAFSIESSSSGDIFLGPAGNLVCTKIYNTGFTSTNTRDVSVKDDGRIGYISSSKRFKKNITNIEKEYSENLIYNSRPVFYSPIEDLTETKLLGFIAEEIAELDPKLVYFDDDNLPCGLDYKLFTVHLVKVAQEQKKTIDDLQSKLEAMEARLSALELK